ncbi:MAG: aminopeptidase P family protein [Christensenellaceae bacterium]|nr:aminopeptidase P family protein [Christensenellaceae bacterium]
MRYRSDKLLNQLAEKNIDSAIITSAVNRRYYSGFTGSNGVVILTAKGRVLLTDFRYTIQANRQCAGICEVRQVNRGIGAADVEAVLKEFGAKRVAFEDAALTVSEFEAYKTMPFELIPDSEAINGGRLVKDADEIAEMQRAQSIADAAFTDLLKVVKVGMTEKEVRNELDYYIRRHGADENSFDTIVGSGPNGALCHAYPGERKLQNGDFVVIDFGARVNGYCSDMTRTIAIGKPCDELLKIYDIVLKAQLKCLEVLRPNMVASELDLTARNFIAENGYGECFGHSLGHGFGLEIHENPYANSRSQELLVPGTTITVEPGIYIEGLGGVRIEDCCVLTEDGYINLCTTTKELIIL